MALTDIQICANALIRLGAQPIQSFDEGTDLATVCATIYPSKAQYILSLYPWRFTMNFAQLSRLTVAPSAQYTYQYALPADRVQGGFPVVFNSSDVNACPIKDYTIIGNRLMTDYDEIWVQYQYQADESLWPFYFTELMINVMKHELCIIVTEDKSLYAEIHSEVFGTPVEQGQGGLLAQAMFLDSRDNPTLAINDFTLINARFGGI